MTYHPVPLSTKDVLEIMMLGRRPYAAFGNSDGDKDMLEYTQAGDGLRLTMLVHHDDAAREYAYGPASKVGTFSDALLSEAHQKGWLIISMAAGRSPCFGCWFHRRAKRQGRSSKNHGRLTRGRRPGPPRPADRPG